MIPKENKALTRKQVKNWMDQMSLQVENNQRAVYDLWQTLTDYMHMQGDFDNFAEYRQELLGFTSRIPTRWSKFSKFCKSRYLRLKKKLDFRF